MPSWLGDECAWGKIGLIWRPEHILIFSESLSNNSNFLVFFLHVALHKMPDSSSDQESQNVGYDSDPDSPAFPHFASTRIQTVGSALASALNSLEDRGAAPASREATLASQERQDIPRIAETCSVLGATPLNRSAGNLNTLHLILPSPSLPLLNGPAHVRIASSLETMRVKQAWSKKAAPAAAPGAGRWKLRKRFH